MVIGYILCSSLLILTVNCRVYACSFAEYDDDMHFNYAQIVFNAANSTEMAFSTIFSWSREQIMYMYAVFGRLRIAIITLLFFVIPDCN